MTTSTTSSLMPTAPKVGSFGDLEPPRLVALRPNLCMACFSLMKMRPATYILDQAGARGELEPGGTICESSSGTFGLALAMLGRARGYRVRLVSSPLSVDQRLLSRLERLGATVEFVHDPAPVGGSQQARLDRLAAIIDETPGEPASAERSVGPRVGWLLILPFMVLVSVAPTGLGAAAADRAAAYTPVESNQTFEPIDDSGGPVEMRVLDFLDRAIWDDTGSLTGVAVRLEGILVNDPSIDDGFKLVRFLVSCCAADGIPLQVVVHGAPPMADDTWVVAEVVWRPPDLPYRDQDGDWLVEADALSITQVEDPPLDPYESPY